MVAKATLLLNAVVVVLIVVEVWVSEVVETVVDVEVNAGSNFQLLAHHPKVMTLCVIGVVEKDMFSGTVQALLISGSVPTANGLVTPLKTAAFAHKQIF